GGAVAALGGGTVMDDANWQLVRQRSMPVYLELSFETIWERIGRNKDRPLVAGRLRHEVADLFERRRPRYEQAAHRVDADRSPGWVACSPSWSANGSIAEAASWRSAVAP